MSTTLYPARIERLRPAMQQVGIDALFPTYGPDFYYLTGIENPPPTTLAGPRAIGSSGLWRPGTATRPSFLNRAG